MALNGVGQTKRFYETIVELKIPHSNHRSDLYIPVTERTAALLKECSIPESSYSIFKNNIDGELWYDVAFAYMPFWSERTANE